MFFVQDIPRRIGGMIPLLLLMFSASPACSQAIGKYADIHGLRMYYEVDGSGSPLVLLHGGSQTIETSFAGQLEAFTASRQVIAPEQMGHGHTADADRPFSYAQMADDTAELLKQLGVENADIVGWSDGGIVALVLALRHPELVRRVVVSGANIRPPTGAEAEGLRRAKPEEWDTAAREAYERMSPDGPSHFPVLVEKLKQLWLSAPSVDDLGPERLQALRKKVLVIAGDHDMVSLSETVEIYTSIGDAQLFIVPGATHFTFRERPELINQVILDFLAGE